MALRLVWRTDVHLSDKTPSSRKDVWSDTVLEKLAQVGEIAEKVQASAVIDGGDFYHMKSPSLNSHRLLRRVMEVHSKYPCPVYANVGNHDCVYGDISFLPQQPLGVLFAAGVFKPLYGENEAFFEKDGVTVRVVGVPYPGSVYDLSTLNVEKGEEDYLIVAAHMYASPAGGSMYGGEDVVKYEDLLSMEPDIFAFGHWHKDQGITKVGGKTIINIGSLTRGSLSDEEVDREPSCAVMAFVKDRYQVKKIPLNVRPSGEVFDLVGKVKKEKKSLAMEAYVQSLHKELLSQESVDVRQKIEELRGLSSQVRERAILYFEQVEKDG